MGLLISGIGLGLLLPNLNVWVVSVIPPATRGRAVGGLTTFIFLGQFLSPIATQPVAQQIGLAGAYIVGAGTMLLLAVVLYGGGVLTKRAKATTSQARVIE